VSLSLINQYLGTIALLIGIGNAVWLWLSRPTTDIKARIDEIQDDFDEKVADLLDGQKGHDRRIQRVEDDMRHLPTKDDLNEISHQVTGMKTELGMVSKTVNRIDEYLRSRP
jgi:HAMP domain-containing protein